MRDDSQDRRFRAVADSVQDALIAADSESRIVFWSASAERIFGWSASEALNQPLTLLMPEAFHAAHLAGFGRVAAGGTPRLLGGPPVELVARRRDGEEFPIELTLGRWEEEGEPFFAGVVRDISDRRRGEQLVAAQFGVATALASSHDLAEGVGHALEEIASRLGWDVAIMWLISEDGATLRCGTCWANETAAAREFSAASKDLTFRRGEGLPGSTWESRQVTWLEDLPSAPNFRRADLATRVGMRSGVAVPLVAEGVDHGVVEFFSAASTETHETAEVALETVAGQLAQFLLRRQAEARLHRQHEHQKQAAELNDDVVQGLVVAHYALAKGEVDAARKAVAETLTSAQDIVGDLLGEGSPQPGDLRRGPGAEPVTD